jgi:hypothetical protein
MSVTEIPVSPDRLAASLRQSAKFLCTRFDERIVTRGARRFLLESSIAISEIKAPPARILEFRRLERANVQNSLAWVGHPSDECHQRGTNRASRILEMSMYSIALDNKITAYATAAEAPSSLEAESFASAKELGRLAAQWPSSRLVDIWNSLPGQKPVKKFMDRKAAVRRIWNAVQNLTPALGAQAAPVPFKEPKPRKRTAEPAQATTARSGSKTSQILDMLKRPGGAALKDIMATTNWQAHSVRGFISGTLGKKMGLNVASIRHPDGERVYSIN